MSLLLLMSASLAEVPVGVSPDCAQDNQSACIQELTTDWRLYSWVPEGSEETLRPIEVELGSGIGADVAWATHTGRFDQTIAVLDSGILWDHSDLRNKVYLNTAELPAPQDADGNTLDYDADGNGLVNIQDYANDPRVSITAGNDRADAVLDPSDLILTFSDGVDDDGNGYADDIAGWDFFQGDNNPFSDWDDGYGTHGTGVARDAAAEANNGGTVGVCPNCSILPVRTGDSFVTDGTRAGQGIAFAVDSGAASIAMAMGALTQPQNTSQAMAYATEQGVVMVVAAADENAYHHNQPAMIHDAIVVISVREEGGNESKTYSFMNFFGCNNFGPRLDFVSGTSDCATGAVANTAGAVGLIQSAAMDELGERLTPAQVKALLQLSADDIYLTPEELEEADTYPSSPGWDPFYGHGRVNVGRAVGLIVDDAIPAEATIDGPEWFSVFYADRDSDPSFEIGSTGESWTVSWGQGWEPDQWTELASGSSSTGSVTLPLAEIPTAAIPDPVGNEATVRRVERVHAPAVTLLLQVTNDLGQVSEARRTIFVHEDPDLLAGFPRYFGASGESSPILVDLDGDAVFEILMGNANGEVQAISGDGSDVPGWPVYTEVDDDLVSHSQAPSYVNDDVDSQGGDGILASLASADLDGDGSPEVVAATLEGRVYVWGADGALRDGFPVRIDPVDPGVLNRDITLDEAIIGAPTLFDQDGDGDLEILVATGDSKLYAWHDDGVLVDGTPRVLCHPDNCGVHARRIVASPSIGDVDGDGDLDIVVGTNETLESGKYSVTHALDAQSFEDLPGWPIQAIGLGISNTAALLPLIGTGHPSSNALGDLTGDGADEIVDMVVLGQPKIRTGDGEILFEPGTFVDAYGADSNLNERSFVGLSGNPSLGDMDGDGVPDLIIGGAGLNALASLVLTQVIDTQFAVGGWSGADATALNGWPRQLEDFQFLTAAAMADLSGDGVPEAVYGSAGYMAYAWDKDGVQPENWPKFTGGWIMGSPAVGDIDGDGYLDIVLGTREGYLFAWTSQGRADQTVQWQSLHHDPANTGNTATELMAQAGPEEGCGRGCGRNKEGVGGGGGVAFVLLLGLGWLRRRKA